MKVITPPAEVLTVANLADHLRLGSSPYPDAALLGAIITAARQHVEEYTRRAVGEQTVSDVFPSFAAVRLRGPVKSITHVKYSTAGVETTLAGTEYVLVDDTDKTELRCAYGKTWPAVDVMNDAVRVQYITGYTTGSDRPLPGPLRAAMLLVAGDLYENREAGFVGTIYTPNPVVERLLSMYRQELGI